MTAFDVDERQVNDLVMSPKGLAFVTGDTGAVYQAQGPAKEAKYTSKVFDADFPARWGNLRWRSTGALTIETRSGNTSKPDRGWSGWAKPAERREGARQRLGARAAWPARRGATCSTA